jgi:hypothetical protein
VAPGLISSWASKYHEVAVGIKEAIILSLDVAVHWLKPLLFLPLLGTSLQVLLHEGAVLIQMLDGKDVVRAWLLQHLLEKIRGLPDGRPASLSVSGSYEGAPVVPLVLLLPWAVRA